MPETRECICCGVVAEVWFNEVCKKGHSLLIKNLWIDPTEKEAEHHSPEGYAFTLNNTSPPFVRGIVKSQKPLFPPTLMKTTLQPDPPPIQSYALVAVEHSPRALILGFRQSDQDGGRTLFLKVRGRIPSSIPVF